MRFNEPTIISCAVTGNHTTRANHPELPVTPEEIAVSCIEAARAGAAIVHIHVRDPVSGKPSMELGLYREVVERIRAGGEDVIINLTTGPGGRFIPSDDEPRVAAPGTSLTTPAVRTEHIVALKPEVSSLDLNTMWSGESVVINTPRNVAKMAELIQGAGVKPELEVFDSGDIHLANDLIAKGVLARPALFQIVLGIKFGAAPTPQTMAYMASLIPSDCQWAAFGIGRMQFPMVAQAVLLGGHVRVGMEDNVFISKGVLAKNNAALVEKAGRIITDLGGKVASAADARAMLKLPPR